MKKLSFCAFLSYVLILQAFGVALHADGSKLALGDVIGVTVDGEKEFTKTYQINRQGFITLPMNVGEVYVVGLNTSDAAEAIANALKKVLKNPQVTVTFIERAKMQVYVVGKVAKRGLIEIGVGDRLMQALAMAGYDNSANLEEVTVRRGDQIIKCNLNKYLTAEDLSVNIELQSGDEIIVPEALPELSVIVLGQVKKTGTIAVKKGTTVREVISLLGGVTLEADTANITIKRDGYNEPIKVDYDKALSGDPQADVVLMSGDTVYVPELNKAYFTVIGGVAKPSQYPLDGKMTATEAIAAAGGAIPQYGDLRKVKIVRATGETITVDLIKAMDNKSLDPQIMRGDVIYVTERKPKKGVFDVLQMLLPFGWIFK